ncbi:MAG TPA: hypothetical protein VFA66_10280 [Gaiellaceae bacterium]|nr:hypothetical protein [Gaiellaceae bacterium]
MRALAGEHWIRRNDISWSPRRVIVLDAEGTTHHTDGGELDEFLLAHASFTVRAGDRDARPRTEEADFASPAELWSWVSARCHTGRTTYLIAHGLHYDYSLTAAHRELPRLGWERVDWSTRAGSRWVRWRRGRRRLLMVDLYNYLPRPLSEIGRTLNLTKDAGNPQGMPRRYWARRCRRDVRIAREAFLRLLDWWDEQDLGRWGLTSASCAMAAFRHRHLRERSIRHHDSSAARSLERRALFGGRREIYRQGVLEDGPWVDLDYVSHYLMTAGSVDVPVRLVQVYDRAAGDPLSRMPPHAGIIADVTIELPPSSPVAPYRHPALGVIYPTGRFRTTLCQPELELVREHGRILRYHQVALYVLEPALESWADWLLGELSRRSRDDPLRPMLKDWTRSLIGKFGQRAPEHTEPPADGEPEVLPEITITVGAGEEDLPWTERPVEDPERGEDAYNSFPALTAWVHSAARAWLWRGMQAVGLTDIAYVDTDGFLARAHEGNLEAIASVCPQVEPSAGGPWAAIPEPEHYRVRPSARERRKIPLASRAETPPPPPRAGAMQVKGRYGRAVIHRPQDYELDGREVIKGLPRDRERLGERTWRARYQLGMEQQLARGCPGTFVRAVRTVHLSEDYLRGWVCDDGRIRPLEVDWARGSLVVVPWAETSWSRAGCRLRDRSQEHAVLARARSPGP